MTRLCDQESYSKALLLRDAKQQRAEAQQRAEGRARSASLIPLREQLVGLARQHWSAGVSPSQIRGDLQRYDQFHRSGLALPAQPDFTIGQEVADVLDDLIQTSDMALPGQTG